MLDSTSGARGATGNANQGDQSGPFESDKADTATIDNGTSRESCDRREQCDRRIRTVTDYSKSPTTAEVLSRSLTTGDRLADQQPANASPTVTSAQNWTEAYDLNPLAGVAGMAARREFNGIPLRADNAYSAYKGMTGDSFSGPDDIRLEQLKKAVDKKNVFVINKLRDAPNIDSDISGRAKTPFSTFGKLRETPGAEIGQIKDLSGLRANLNPTRPGFQEYYQTQEAIKETLGDGLQLKKDYIKQPNPWGYTGRIHSTMTEVSGLTHEIQVGSTDLSKFIDHKLTTAGGDSILLHDATGYKGQIYGAKVPDHLQTEYTQLMRRITEANGAGQQVADLPELQRDISQFYRSVEESLPVRLNQPPAPELSPMARAGNIAAKGFGVLGVAGGTLQTVNGVNTLASGGDTVEGVADVGAGGTTVASSVALMGGRVALGTATGGAVAVIDGAKDVYTGIRDGDVEKTAVGTVKAGAGTAMIAGVATANPILIAGGAIAYGGAVIYESRDAIASAAKGAWNWATSWL
jgi:ppGpp synthetase/RelA/SpoT-type nucleotidyltranferase